MGGQPVSIAKITVPILYVVAMAGSIASAVYAWDTLRDDIASLKASAAFHVSLHDMRAEIKTLKLQRIHDNINRVQSALNFYDGKIETGEPLTQANVTAYSSYKAELRQYQCELSTINLGVIGDTCK